MNLKRYARQMECSKLASPHQERLLSSRITIIGCGALGCALASLLARAGVGYLRIIDNDVVNLKDLHRQILFDENDVLSSKVCCAKNKIKEINSNVETNIINNRVDKYNIQLFCHDVDLILDGTDNLETRYLINDIAVKLNKPWIYGACATFSGMVMTIIPNITPCLRCVFPEANAIPPLSDIGVINTIPVLVASFQVVEAIKILSGQLQDVNKKLLCFNGWEPSFHLIDTEHAYSQGNCICCKEKKFEYLE